ncbi:MAG: transporter [Vicingaceae bacterium]
MKSLITASLLLITFVGFAQQEETVKAEIGSISTDRPVQSETPFTVPKKHLQGEMGFNYISYGLIKQFDGPNLLLKYGILNNLELRFTNNYLSLQSKVGGSLQESSSGADMSIVGLKYKILHESSNGLNLTVSGSSKLDLFADQDYAFDEVNFLLRTTSSKTISGSWYGIVGLEYGYYDKSDDQCFYVLQTGTALAKNLTGVIEYYGYFDSTDLMHAINGAFVYLINDNHQVDISGGFGLTDNFYDYYFQVGYSFRVGL